MAWGFGENRFLQGSALPALVAAALASLILCEPATASRDQLTFFDAPHELDGSQGQTMREHSLDELAALGVDVVRVLVDWPHIGPNPGELTPPPEFDPRDPNTYGPYGARWFQIDAIVRGAEARGMEVALVATGEPPTGRVPLWASHDPLGSQSDPDPGQYGDWVHAIAKRYGGGLGSVGDVGYISIWNEPNVPLFLNSAQPNRDQAIPALYRRMVESALAGLSSAGWRGQTLIGESGPSQPGKQLDPLPFMRNVLCLDGRNRPTGGCRPLDATWAHHPYSFAVAPFKHPRDPGQVTFGNLKAMERAVAGARRGGTLQPGARLYITEYGFPTNPKAIPGVSIREQAEFNALAEYIAYRSRGIAAISQYLLHDEPPAGTLTYGFRTGLCPLSSPRPTTYGGLGSGCKLAYGAFRTPLVVRKISKNKVAIWGHVRLNVGRSLVTLRHRGRGGRARTMRTVSTDRRGYFSLVAEGQRGRWSASWNGYPGPFVRAYGF